MKYFILTVALILMDVVSTKGCHRDGDEEETPQTEQVESTTEIPAEPQSAQ